RRKRAGTRAARTRTGTSAAFMDMMFLLPVAALLTGRVLVNVTYPDFLLHFVPMSIVLTLFAFLWRATATFMPHDAKLLGWEG
ncbi:hypothetical protein AB9F36_33890, partial [Rhizobium leguminosarum]